jgi:hypothetical protein
MHATSETTSYESNSYWQSINPPDQNDMCLVKTDLSFFFGSASFLSFARVCLQFAAVFGSVVGLQCEY